MFIGRDRELQLLEDCYKKENGQLVVLYGRRRVGKTETLRKFCRSKPHVFYSCTECPDDQQLTAFSERMLTKDLPAAKYIQRFSDWQDALISVEELPWQEKKLLIIDEFPYMVKGNPRILSILQNLWDERLKDKDVMIILCGSAMSFIEKEILSEKSPLYGRATAILKMNPLPFQEAIQFFPEYSFSEKIGAYAVLGGIPHYLKQFDADRSLAENICDKVLSPGSILYSEVEFLMRQELRETATYNVVIEAVAMGNTKMNDIHQKTMIDKNKLSVYLKNLIDLGLMRRHFSVVDGIKNQANVQRGLYQVTDNFFRFWYAFVFPNISELESGDVDGIWNFVVKPEFERHSSYFFENICIDYLRQENRSSRLPFRFTKIGRWWDKRDEIDIMATNPPKDRFIIGECKYRNRPFSLSDFIKTKEKFSIKQQEAKIYYYLFSKSGFSEELIRLSQTEDIQMITAEQVVDG